MEIRRSTWEDAVEILHVFDAARAFMAAQGNADQWRDGYPGQAELKTDIESRNSYVLTENGRIIGTFAFILGEEPSYRAIRNGRWHSGGPYGTIHRLASDGTGRGVARACFDFCRSLSGYMRIDTHKDNRRMLAAIAGYGFRKCGNIYVRDGSERIAFDYLEEPVGGQTGSCSVTG